ncbi:MAG: glycosyltransferase [Pyrinomonadaceae bacterium]
MPFVEQYMNQPPALAISLVIPLRDEADSIAALVDSINRQTYQPSEIVLVDGGSTDKTIDLAREFTKGDQQFRIIEAGDATPGRGRNVGAANAKSEWIAFTDAGIRLETNWLEELVKIWRQDETIDVIYGNYEPEENTFFERCAALAYVSPKTIKNGELWRGQFIASSLMRREVWQKVGGFPDLRAAEDLIFMENIEKQNFRIGCAPRAVVWWKLRPTLGSTFQKFVLYSKHNVWARREQYWHYGVLQQYLVVAPFFVLALLHSWLWLMAPFLWLSARTFKSIWTKRSGKNLIWMFNPFQFLTIAFLLLTIDAATFIGWAQALTTKPPTVSTSEATS